MTGQPGGHGRRKVRYSRRRRAALDQVADLDRAALDQVADLADARDNAAADFDAAVVDAYRAGIPARQIAEAAGISHPAVYRRLAAAGWHVGDGGAWHGPS